MDLFVTLLGIGIKALFLVQVDTSEEKPHGEEDEDGDPELVREEESTQHRSEHVGSGRAVLFYHVVQLLQDGGHHQPPHTAEQETQHQEHLHLGGGGAQGVENVAGAEVGRGDDVDKAGHHHAVQVQPELLVQEILTGVLEDSNNSASLDN